MCCKGCCSRRISKVQAYVLFGFCTLIAIVGVALVVYGVIWDTKPTPEEFGMPVLYSIYKEQEGFQGYNLFYTVYKQTLSWAGFLSLIPALFGMMAVACGRRTVKMAMLITIVSFVSLTSTMSAAGVSGSMLTDMNVLQNAKDRGRCSFINGNWSSYCECRMNSDDPSTRKVGRISGDGCSVIPKLCSLLIKNFATSLTAGILSAILFYAGLLVFCNPQKEYSSVDGDNKDRDEQKQEQHHQQQQQQPRPLTDAPPAYNSIGSYNSQYQTQSGGYNEGHQGYASYTAQQPMYAGTAGATAGPSAPPVQDARSEKEEKRRLLDH